MFKREEWYSTDIIGKLFIDTVLVEVDFPILFTCYNETENHRYLVETLNPIDGIYLIVPIDTPALLNMIQDRTSLERTFRQQKTAYLSCFDDDFNLCLKQIDNGEIPAEDLPEPEVYFEFSNQKIQKYIEILENELSDKSCSIIVVYENNPNLKVLENNLYEFYQPKLMDLDCDYQLIYDEKHDDYSIKIKNIVIVNALNDNNNLSESGTLQRAA